MAIRKDTVGAHPRLSNYQRITKLPFSNGSRQLKSTNFWFCDLVFLGLFPFLLNLHKNSITLIIFEYFKHFLFFPLSFVFLAQKCYHTIEILVFLSFFTSPHGPPLFVLKRYRIIENKGS